MSVKSWRGRCAAAFAVGMLAVGPAMAQTVAPMTIGSLLVVDVQYLLRESKAAKSIRQQIEQQSSTYNKDLSKQESDLRAAREELERQRTILSEQAFAGRVQEFQQKVSELRENASAKSQVLQRGGSAATKQVLDVILQVVSDIATERKAMLVLAKNEVVLVDKSLDITDDTLKRLDQRLPTVAVNTTDQAKPASTAAAPTSKSKSSPKGDGQKKN